MSMLRAEPSASVQAILEAMGTLKVYDVTPTIDSQLEVWYTHEPPAIIPIATHENEGVAANIITFNEHTGAHVDAPFHFDAEGLSIADVPIESLLLRPYCKYDLTADDPQPGELVGLEHLKAAEARAGFALQPGDVAIIEFGWDKNLPGGSAGRERGWWGRNEPGLSATACDYLAAAGVAAVASDTAACDIAVRDGEIVSAHGHAQAFLPHNILIIEGIEGLAAAPATGLLLALPLKIAGGSGSPVRVILLGE